MITAAATSRPGERSPRPWVAVACADPALYSAVDVMPPEPGADFGMPRGLLDTLVVIRFMDRARAALAAVRHQAVARLVALWPVLARLAASPWAELRAALEMAGIIRQAEGCPPPRRPSQIVTECCPRTGPPAGRGGLSLTGGALIGL